jgi:hypothetical protein
MKTNSYFIILILLLTIAACKKDNSSSNSDVKPVTININLSYEAAHTELGMSLEKTQVKITNLTTTQTYTAAASADGSVEFKDVAPGNYDVSAVQTISAADYNLKAGTNLTEAVIFNGILSRQSLVQNSKLSIVLKTGRVGDLVIKQIYYSGSHVTNGAVFRDQFVEIYNNSNATLYADSLYFGQIVNVSSALNKVDFSRGYYLPGGQYDWTKSIGMSNSKANTDYVYMSSLFMIPGNGKQYPILPGTSIIIASNAMNHKMPYTGTDGKAIAIKDPSLTVDLSKADFEVYLGNQNDINPLASDLDNPAVPNLTVLDRGSNRDLVLDVLGRDGLVIFKSAADPRIWKKFPTPDVVQVIASTKTYYQVPVAILIDGVGLNQTAAINRAPKYMNDVIDAGEIFTAKGSYSSQSVLRKTNKMVNGRVILKDTNNSSNDFGVLNLVDASKSASSFIN